MPDTPYRAVAGGNVYDADGNPVNVATLFADSYIDDDDVRAINEKRF